MSEQVYQQAEMAIQLRLHTFKSWTWSGPYWVHPIRIELGNIVMLKSDGGIESRSADISIWTTDDWVTAIEPNGDGLFKKVGLWEFNSFNDPASDLIAFCHRSPDAAGRTLLRNEELIKRLTTENEILKKQLGERS